MCWSTCSARLNEHNDTYEGQIFNLNIARIRITDDYIKMYDKLLGGIWCIINLAYEFDENSKESPFKILSLKPVQMPAIIRDSRRFVIGRGLEEGDAVNTWNAEEVGLTDSHAENGTGISPLQVQTAKGLNRIRKQGAGSRFVHGGSMPQEVMVPVLHVNIKKKQGVSDVSVDILNKKSKITTNTQTISFYQNEPVSEKVKEVTLRFGFYDQAGNLLSDPITLTFGSTSEDSTQREQKHRFMFKRQLSDLNGQEIYLRKEQQVAGSSQFKKLEDIAYKVSVLFMAEF